MTTEQPKTRYCFNCNAQPAYPAYIGNQRIHLCDSAECEREAAQADRQAEDEARMDAETDKWSRYL